MNHEHRPFTWVVALTVDPVWVADGFTINDERAHGLLTRSLPSALNTEFGGRVLAAPAPEDIADTQGYTAGRGRATLLRELRAGTPHADKLAAVQREAAELVRACGAHDDFRPLAVSLATALNELARMTDPAAIPLEL